MSIPPPGIPPTATGHLLFNGIVLPTTQTVAQVADAESVRVVSMIKRGISDSIRCRDAKLAALPREIADPIINLGRELDRVDCVALERCQVLVELKALEDREYQARENNEDVSQIDAELKPLEAEYDTKNREMNALIRELRSTHSGRQPGIDFSPWYQLNLFDEDKRALALEFCREQVMNQCVNTECFLFEATSVLKKNQVNIVSFFYTAGCSDAITFRLVPNYSETHNRGKIPLKVDFYSGENKLFSIFFKPRDAEIDRSIIQVFDALNRLSSSVKSSVANLPVYKIGVSDEGEIPCSFWEFIEGKQASEGTVSQFVEGRSLDKECLREQLLRLESVCSFLEVSDLHVGNVIFTHLGQPEAQIVPIDLESIQPGAATGLGSMPREVPLLTDEEKKLLMSCKEESRSLTVRFVPVATSCFLAGLMRYNAFVDLTADIWRKMQDMGYQTCIGQNELEWMVLTDFLHNDVPYFTIRGASVYFGQGNDARCVAKR